MFISNISCFVFCGKIRNILTTGKDAVHFKRLEKSRRGLGQNRGGMGEEKGAGKLQANQVSVLCCFVFIPAHRSSNYVERVDVFFVRC